VTILASLPAARMLNTRGDDDFDRRGSKLEIKRILE
jgi:hypothetical protein